MKKIILPVSLLFFVCLLGFSDNKTWTVDDNIVEYPNLNHTPARLIRVLYRVNATIDIAGDGAMFYVGINEAGLKARPDWKHNINLQSTERITVEEDEFVDESKTQWKRNPTDFDFIVSLHEVMRERPKFSFSEQLVINVSESYIAEKVSDPTVKKTWETSYSLVGTPIGQIMTESAKKKEQLSQAETIVAKRGTILKEIRAFIESASR